MATDIAARGIDVDGITHVINYDLPNVPESYVHRIGRTARAGSSGIAISFCDAEERAYLRDIEALIKVRIPVVDHPWQPAAVATKAAPQRPTPVRTHAGGRAGAGPRVTRPAAETRTGLRRSGVPARGHSRRAG